MAEENQKERKGNIQQQPSKGSDSKKPDTPVPPQQKDPQAKPTDSKDRKK